MTISAALMYARMSSNFSIGLGLYAKARLGATRLNYFGPHKLLTVNGTSRRGNYDDTTWSITDRGRGQGKTLTIELFGFTPVVGDPIVFAAGSLSNRLFTGTITRVTQGRTKKNEGRLVYTCQCVDGVYQASNLKVTTRYANLSASTIAIQLVTFAPAGFGSQFVQGGLATVDEIHFTEQTLPTALQQLADRVGGWWYFAVDEAGVWQLHFGVGTDRTGVPPEAITGTNPHIRSGFRYAVDIEGLYNRVWCEGMGSSLTVPVTAGFTSIPLEDVAAFSDSGTNYAKIEAHQPITYTGKSSQDGEGAVTSGVPGSAPSSPAPVYGATSGNLGVGAYDYQTTFVSALGESSASPTAGVSIPDVTVPGVVAAALHASTGLLAEGTHRYAVTFTTSAGETTPGSTTSITITQVSAPGSGGSPTGTTGGSLTPGSTYIYAFTFVTPSGETEPGSTSVVGLTGGQNAVSFSGSVPVSSDTRVTARKVYRTLSGGGLKFLVGTIGDNVTTSFSDTTADASVGAAAPSLNSTGFGKVNLSSIPVSADPRVTGRKLYRTIAGGSVLLLLTTIGDNVTTTYADNTADGSLGAGVPVANTAGTGRVTVNSIALGPVGTTSRKVYRTTVGGATFKLLTTIADNVTTTYADNTADGSLGATFSGPTLGAAPGDTVLKVSDLSKFPDGGWVRASGGQTLYFTARAATTGEGNLTGIPATGPGAVTAIIPAGSTVLVAPHLLGIPASGAGAIQNTLAVGDTVNLYVKEDDASSQATYGLREYFVQDRRLSLEGASDRAAAELALRKDPRVTGGGATTDPKMAAGRILTINHSGWGLTATVYVQTVTITPKEGRPQVMADVEFASRSTEDLYSTLREIREHLNR
jgi:hypothetical protein